MNLSLFSDLSPAIQIHIVTALLAVVLGPVVLFRPRRDALHRTLGYVWVMAMAVVALSSFMIHSIRVIGPFSPIHALSVYTLYGLVQAIRAARARRIAEHRATMRWLYFWSMGVAGLFTLLPGRAMHRVLFGADTWAGFVLIVAGVAIVFAFSQWRRANPV